MNISHWPLNRIMQLPDHLFGRRFPISVEVSSYNEALGVDISEIALPEVCVIWQFIGEFFFPEFYSGYSRVALADQLATTEAQFLTFQPLLHGYGEPGVEPRRIMSAEESYMCQIYLRMPVQASGKRLTAMAMTAAAKSHRVRFTIVVSSIPTELPDWMILNVEKKE